MDEWDAETDWRDESGADAPQADAPAGLLRATLLFGLVAILLAVFVAPDARHGAAELADRTVSGLDRMATGSIAPRRSGATHAETPPFAIAQPGGGCPNASESLAEPHC